MDNKIIVIAGPTASGKTKTAVELAEIIDGEIISCDSMQVYRDMPILTQAPSWKEMKGIPHYLVSEISPESEYCAALFKENAGKIIAQIIERGKVPIITGGTGLYIKALIDGLFPAPEKSYDLRKKLENIVKEKGKEALYEDLSRHDPDTAEKIHPNDVRRVIRALEVFYLTGMAISSHKKNTKGIKNDYEIIMLGINPEREKLYENINARVEAMFKNGLVNEVKRVNKMNLSLTARSALGIKEVNDYLSGLCGIAEAKETLKQNTRRYAKRQMTWFRAEKRIKWFNDGEGLINYCRSII